MLAPRAGEKQKTPRLATLSGPCGVSDFVAAASDWRQDALGNKENILILYFAGHSLELTDMNPVLVFQDFGDGVGPALCATVCLANLIDGLAPSDWQNQVARQQFMFIDTDRIPPTGVPAESLRRPTEVFNVPRRGTFDDRRSCLLYGTAPGGTPYYVLESVTFLNLALMNCLQGATAETLAPDSSCRPTAWWITTRSLGRGVQAELDELKRIHEVEQRVAWRIQGENAVLVQLEGPPETTLSMRFDPLELRPKVRVVVHDEKLKPIRNVDPDPKAKPDSPIEIKLLAGIYGVEASVDEVEGKPLWQSIVKMVPLRVELLARIKR